MATTSGIELSPEVMEANADFNERLRSHAEDIEVSYDPEADLLFLTMGVPQEAVMEPTSDELRLCACPPRKPEDPRVGGDVLSSPRN